MTCRVTWRALAQSATLILAGCVTAGPQPPEYAVKKDGAPKTPFIEQVRKRLPPLKHARGNRLPMILWEGVPAEPQAPEVYKTLIERGLAQPVRLEDKSLAAAQVMHQAGQPVIMMQGSGGPWPAQLAGDPKLWQHQFEAGYVFKPGPYPDNAVRPCLALYDGWAINANAVRDTLRKFKAAGVPVSGVWMDWEGDPYFFHEQYTQASHCARCKALLPAWVLASQQNCSQYCARLYLRLLDAYLAAPVAEVFPDCSTTNWMVVWSTPEKPVLGWGGRGMAPGGPGLLTHTNPVAYGNTVYWKFWKPEWPLDREHVDIFYLHLFLRQVSVDAANCRVYAPEKRSLPWVARWCPDDENLKIPIPSRESYREALRHIWLRGAASMQIFNATRPGFEDIVFGEVEDAVAVYDEMLAFAPFLAEGEIMCCDVPEMQDTRVLWSGLRRGDQAVVRAVKLGGGSGQLTFEPWPGRSVTLDADAAGHTFMLERQGERVTVKRQ